MKVHPITKNIRKRDWKDIFNIGWKNLTFFITGFIIIREIKNYIAEKKEAIIEEIFRNPEKFLHLVFKLREILEQIDFPPFKIGFIKNRSII